MGASNGKTTVHPDTQAAAADSDESPTVRREKKRAPMRALPETENFNNDEVSNFILKEIPKDAEATSLLTLTLKSHLLFTGLDDETLAKIVGAMERVDVSTGEILITQGDTGDNAMRE